jgi:osmotically-inducible protein OsmY
MKSILQRALFACFLLIFAGVSHAQSASAPADATMTPGAAPPATGTTGATSTTKSDRALAHDVRRALSRAQGFNVSGVFVRARSGAVTLSGTVRTGDQIRQAEEVTRSVQGVTSVSNKLTLFHGGNG